MRFRALNTKAGEVGSKLSTVEFRQAGRQLSRTSFSDFLSADALATWEK